MLASRKVSGELPVEMTGVAGGGSGNVGLVHPSTSTVMSAASQRSMTTS